ncbi:hypothetical protein TCAL_14175, partial [Tigriopus californicus]|eukprot:TCALIF_14175-PA protein Name:"Protein of unknown function" AED:0.07 eAED:0.07 QI:0/-1/0/1/-1/1/1/0/120
MSVEEGTHSGQLEGIDPRVKWAFDLYDMQGVETMSILDHYQAPTLFGLAGLGVNVLGNMFSRRPLKAGIQWTILGGLLGTWLGVQTREFNANRRQKRIQTTLHYVMLHPERFPEPERKKY